MNKYKLGEFRHKIEICDSVSKPSVDGSEIADRVPLTDKPIHAVIDGATGSSSVRGFRISKADRETATHVFVIREQCDFEPSAGHWVFREYRGRSEWYRVLSTSDVMDGMNHYTRLTCALWVRDSVKLDPETQDVPCEDIAPDDHPVDYRDFL